MKINVYLAGTEKYIISNIKQKVQKLYIPVCVRVHVFV